MHRKSGCLFGRFFGGWASALRLVQGAINMDVETSNPKAGRVLVVDDNAICRRSLCFILQRAGYETTEADGSRAALEQLRHERFDCVLMDLQMPDEDGLSATAKLRRLEEDGPRTPVIAVSDCDQREFYRRCLEAGMNGFLPKPVDRERLLTLLGMYRALAEDNYRPVAV
jgi:CheY-like chemotaxis protein